MGTRSSSTYRSSTVALLRATTWPEGLDLFDGDLFGDDVASAGIAWLASVWRHDQVREAVERASPVLSRQIDATLDRTSTDARRVRRVVISLVTYLLRWQRRPTPFGLFAGVTDVAIERDAGVRWGERHRTSARSDATWLGDVVDRLHQCPELLDRLDVVVNNAAVTRGDRFVAPGPPPAGQDSMAPIEISVRRTRPVCAALRAASQPVTVGDLRKLLGDEFPTARADRIGSLLTGLVEQRLLISNLWAPMTCPDALGHVCGTLRLVAAESVPAVRALLCELDAIHDDLSGHADHRTAVSRMRAVSDATETPLTVDTVLDADVRIPAAVAREARDAVDVLYRLSPYPVGYPAWRDYHARFRARYGSGAIVPVLDLVADSGLGLPADFLGSAHGRTPRQVTERDEKLSALIQRSIVDGTGEVVLTDAVIDDLAPRNAEILVPARAEMAVEIRSRSVDDLSSGAFTLVVTGTPRPGSSMAGRHVGLLPTDVRDEFRRTYAATCSDGIAAQLSFAPRKRRNDNVARTAPLLAAVIGIGEHHPADDIQIQLDDLAVTADARAFFLIQVSTGRRIEPRVGHALEAGVHTPPLARFLAEITTARCAVYKAFHFGAAAALPYLPRVRYRRTVLAPARWILTRADVAGASTTEWDTNLAGWRARWRVPEHVAIVDLDRRLPLDLSRRLDRSLLRDHLERSDCVELREATAPADLAWLGRAHEVLIPFILDKPAPAPSLTTSRRTVLGAGLLPGASPVLAAQIHGHPARHDEILTSHLAVLLDTFDEQPRWWFHRHRELRRPDSPPYLALFLRLPDASEYGPAAELVAAWAEALRHDRLLSQLVLTTYEPQTGRFGEGAAMERAHDVFAADSAAAIAQIRIAARGGAHGQALAAASMLDLAVGLAETPDDAVEQLVRQLPQEGGPGRRELRDEAVTLADPLRSWPTLRSRPGGAQIAAAWHSRAVALDGYRRAVAEHQRDPRTVLRSLLHLHHVRALAVDPDTERMTNRLVRACALRLRALRRTS